VDSGGSAVIVSLPTARALLPTHLSLLLFVLGVGADHAHGPLSADDLAVFTDSTNAGTDFHFIT
jgi:hypothetical protein